METPGPFNEKEPSAEINKSNNNKKKICKWNEDAVKLLLAFLIERKEEVNNLSTKHSRSSNTKANFDKTRLPYFLMTIIANILLNSVQINGKTLKRITR